MSCIMSKFNVYDNDELIGTELDTDKVSALTGIDRKNVHTYSNRGRKYKGRYLLVRVTGAESEPSNSQNLTTELLYEWDRVHSAYLKYKEQIAKGQKAILFTGRK